MSTRLGISLGAFCFAVVMLSASHGSAQIPPAITVPGEIIVATFHAEGVQIYECRYDYKNKLFWMLREPVASLIVDGQTIGFHFAGQNWQHIDGSSVRAKMVSAAPGATFSDIPWLKLEATDHRGEGVMSRVAMIQRINTKGGTMQGSCETPGIYRSVPYSADYVFLRKRG
jgi:uncharacterized protein DUF3455